MPHTKSTSTGKTTPMNKRPSKATSRKKTSGTAPTGGGKAPSGPLTGGNGTTASGKGNAKPKARMEISAGDMKKLRGY